jgi:hypothetical protein
MAELVALGDHAPDEGLVARDTVAEQEEGRGRFVLGEQVEDRRRGRGQGTVVEGQGDGAGCVRDVPERRVRSRLPPREERAVQAGVGTAPEEQGADEQGAEEERERTAPAPVPARSLQRIRDFPCPSQ